MRALKYFFLGSQCLCLCRSLLRLMHRYAFEESMPRMFDYYMVCHSVGRIPIFNKHSQVLAFFIG